MTTLLLIHGGLWDDMDAERFWRLPGIAGGLQRRGFSVIAPDRPRRAPSWAAEAEHLASFLPGTPVTVVAGSNGCSVAVRLALAHPQAVSGLVLAWPAGQTAPGVRARIRDMLTSLGASPSTVEALTGGETLPCATDQELATLAMPAAVFPPAPANLYHQRDTVDSLLRLLPSAVELPGCPEPPRPEFPPHLESLLDSIAAFAGLPCQTGFVRSYGLRFDVNCSILFTELPLPQRPAAAKAAGFDAVEFWWPFEESVPGDKDADAFVDAIKNAGVDLISLNFHAGDMAAGERGILSDPGKARDFRENIGAVTEIARRAGCTRLNAPYGNRIPGAEPAEQDAVAIENLTLAAKQAVAIDATVLVEAINSVDVPAHVQVADVPGRGAPGTGTLDFEPLFKQLAAQGYTGTIGLEYLPSEPADSVSSFGWL